MAQQGATITVKSAQARLRRRRALAVERRAALAWWTGRAAECARCDQCCEGLQWGEGYLIVRGPVSGWLLCESCARQLHNPAMP